MSHIQTALQESVLDDFKLLLGGGADARPGQDSIERLAAGCLVVNALGLKVCVHGVCAWLRGGGRTLVLSAQQTDALAGRLQVEHLLLVF